MICLFYSIYFQHAVTMNSWLMGPSTSLLSFRSTLLKHCHISEPQAVFHLMEDLRLRRLCKKIGKEWDLWTPDACMFAMMFIILQSTEMYSRTCYDQPLLWGANLLWQAIPQHDIFYTNKPPMGSTCLVLPILQRWLLYCIWGSYSIIFFIF